MLWNDPMLALPAPDYAQPEPRRMQDDRRTDERRATLGDRRSSIKRTLRSLLRL